MKTKEVGKNYITTEQQYYIFDPWVIPKIDRRWEVGHTTLPSYVTTEVVSCSRNAMRACSRNVTRR